MANNKKVFAIVGCGCLAAAVAIAALIAFGFLGVFGMLKKSEAFEESFQRVGTHPAAVAALGEPIEAGFFVTGSVNLNNDDGEADINYSVSGPNGSGTVYVTGTKSAGTWTYSRMELVLDGPAESSETIDLQRGP